VDNWSNTNSYSGHSVRSLFVDGGRWSNLKEEAVESGHCSLKEFEEGVVLKDEEYASTDTLKQICQNDEAYEYNYGFNEDEETPLSVSHVQSLLLYTDFSSLCTAFSATFRARFVGEELEAIKDRHKHFYFMAKLLRETVECFGEILVQPNDDRRYFSGLNRLMVVPEFLIRL